LNTGSYVRKGDCGNGVLMIQQALNTKGANPKVDESGVFDNSTMVAVKAFQKQNNLDVDGIVGPATFQALGIVDV
jgi:peptidoglycan hydrolase-like protein with peptidoglycan-binding domain